MMPTNEQIAELLENMAFLLEIKGDTVFKIRAYQRAARSIENLSAPLVQALNNEEAVSYTHTEPTRPDTISYDLFSI